MPLSVCSGRRIAACISRYAIGHGTTLKRLLRDKASAAIINGRLAQRQTDNAMRAEAKAGAISSKGR